MPKTPPRRELKTDSEIAGCLRPLTDSEFERLEQQCTSDGRITDPIIVWSGHDVIVDGHNRYRIAKTHDLPFDVQEMEFEDLDELKQWIRQRQVGRRNLDKAESTILIKKHLEEHPEADTAELSAALDLSPRQVQRIRQGEKAKESLFPPDIQERIDAGNLIASINSKSRVESLTPEERDSVWEKLREDASLPMHKAMPPKKPSIKVSPEQLEALKSLSPSNQQRISQGRVHADAKSIKKFSSLAPAKQVAVDEVLSICKEHSLADAIEEVELYRKQKNGKKAFDQYKAAQKVDDSFGRTMREIDDYMHGMKLTGCAEHNKSIDLLKQSKVEWAKTTV